MKKHLPRAAHGPGNATQRFIDALALVALHRLISAVPPGLRQEINHRESTIRNRMRHNPYRTSLVLGFTFLLAVLALSDAAGFFPHRLARAAGASAPAAPPAPPPPGCPRAIFAPVVEYGGVYTSGEPKFLATADLNLDGKLDLIMTTKEWTVVYLGNGAGKFSQAPGRPLGSTEPSYLAAGDFNLDGRPDIAIGGEGKTGEFEELADENILLGDGTGDFPNYGNSLLGRTTWGTAVDFNQDGKLDLIGCSVRDFKVRVGFGNGSGNVGSNQVTVDNLPGAPISGAIGDFNEDGWPDLALVYVNNSNLLTVLLNDGGHGFRGRRIDISLDVSVLGVAAGDVNGDGKTDLVMASVFQRYKTLLGNGKGDFSAPPR